MVSKDCRYICNLQSLNLTPQNQLAIDTKSYGVCGVKL